MSEDGTIVEDEYLVYAELCDNTDPNIFNHAETSFKAFALDSDQPILTIGGQAFVGKYKDTVGTAVFLEDIPPGTEERIGFGNEPSDPLFVDTPEKKLRYVCHTRKSLEMSRVLLLEKKRPVEEIEKVDDSKECGTPSALDLSSEGWKDVNLESVDKPIDEPMRNPCVDGDEMESQDQLSLSSLDGGQMIENIEKMKIVGHDSNE